MDWKCEAECEAATDEGSEIGHAVVAPHVSTGRNGPRGAAARQLDWRPASAPPTWFSVA